MKTLTNLLILLVTILSLALFNACGNKGGKVLPEEEECLDFDEDGFKDIECGGKDCDDSDASINPEASEVVCNEVDEDCNGSDDCGCADTDSDGYFAIASTCEEGNDCDDINNTIFPSAEEVCDEVDNNCDGVIDEGVCEEEEEEEEEENPPVLKTYFKDEDGDGFGDLNESAEAESKPAGYVENSDDCNDEDSSINPSATEIACNEIDEDCSGADECTVIPSLKTFYFDYDEDGFGDPNVMRDAYEQPEGYVENNTDCNDEEFSINPEATELCNAIDDNCDGQIDEAWLDTDLDGEADCVDTDDDGDGILEDAISGDYPCTGGETENCDDNCPGIANPEQKDFDSDGVGIHCETSIVFDLCTHTEVSALNSAIENINDEVEGGATIKVSACEDGMLYDVEGTAIEVENKNITLIKDEESADFTFIDSECESRSQIFFINLSEDSNSVTVSDFKLDGEEVACEKQGIRVYFSHAELNKVVVKNMEIKNFNTTSCGAAVEFDYFGSNNEIQLLDSVIYNNTSDRTHYLAGTIAADLSQYYPGNSLIIANNEIYGNETKGLDGGGITVRNKSDRSFFSIVNNKISSNETTNRGGGIYFYNDHAEDSIIEITQNIINGNISTSLSSEDENYGGGIYFFEGAGSDFSDILIANNTINGNTAQDRGSALCFENNGSDSSITIANNLITDHSVVEGEPIVEALYMKDNGTRTELTIEKNGFYGNSDDLYYEYYDYSASDYFYIDTCLGLGQICLLLTPYEDSETLDFYLREESAAINAGINLDWKQSDVDFEENPRIRCGVIDLGVYEVQFDACPAY